MRRTTNTLAMVALVALAGCTGGILPGGDGGSGTMNFYVSDQPGAIEDFEHLNVTVTEVELKRANNETITRDVNDTTVDLTRLEGSNASLIDTIDVPAGNYTGVFLHAGAVTGTLADGGDADVKLASEKLILNTNFSVEDGEEIDFVYDVMVTKAGQSGKYVIRPVATESGTDVPIDRVNASARGDGGADAGADENAQRGSLAFYLSDERNAIDDFAHLNVTVTGVGFQQGGESGNWTERDVDNRTVDLTRLKGDNATLLERYDLAAGNYTKVFIHVSEVNGTLENGSHPDVKLPSAKLHLNTDFTVEANESTEFVYDLTVVKRGQSGAYNIKPVVSESGTDVPIDERGDGADGDDGAEEATALNATFVGNVTTGENATVSVTDNGSAVENASVTVTITANGTGSSATYRTDADGTVTFAVPEDADELEVEVEYDGASVTLERRFGSGGAAEANGQSGGQGNDSDTLSRVAA